MLFLVGKSISYAQVEGPCADSLARANSEFEFGRFYNLPKILEGCLNKGFTKEQRIQAHYLLTRNAIFLDKSEMADANFLSLLKIDPEYRVDTENDPIEIVYLSKNFVTTPIISLNLNGGSNFSTIDLINDYSTSNADSIRQSYDIKWGFQIGGGSELHFSNALSLGVNINFSYKQYGHREYFFETSFLREDISQDISDESKYQMEQIWIDLPLFFKYTFNRYPYLRPYVTAGFQFNYLLNSRSLNSEMINIEPTNDNSDLTATTVSEPPFNTNELFDKFNNSLVFGVGSMYRIKYNYIFVEFQYSPGLTNIANVNNRFPLGESGSYNYPINLPLGRVQDDIRLNTFKINVGYILPKYKPRKKDALTIRDFFENLSKKGEGDD